MTNDNTMVFDVESHLVHDVQNFSQLEMGKIYWVWKEDEVSFHEFKKSCSALLEGIDTGMQFFSYSLTKLDPSVDLSEKSNLTQAIAQGCNVILPLLTPNERGQQYLVAQMAQHEVEVQLPLLMMEAENKGRSSIEEALIHLAYNAPEVCQFLLKTIESGGPEDEYELELDVAYSAEYPVEAENEPNGEEYRSCQLAAAMELLPPCGVIAGVLSYQQSRKVFERFVENCNFLKQSEKRSKLTPEMIKEMERAKQEIDFVFNTMWGSYKNMEGLRHVFINQGKKKLATYYDDYLNREKMAESSQVTISIEQKGKEKGKKNDGFFRVYVSHPHLTDKVLLHFVRKPSCIVYIMYLMDRKHRGDNIDTIQIEDNRELFHQLYHKIYFPLKSAEDENEFKEVDDIFDGLFNKIEKGKNRQARLTDCFGDIRHAVEEAFQEIGEDVVPFIIPNHKSHVTVLPEKIEIADELKDLQLIY